MSMRAADENTEILLTEYIEGRLDPSRRAEIDAYLAANPREKLVIDELIAQRLSLASLPGEQSPAEVGELIQSQLERAVLLEDLSEIHSGRSHRGIRPQLLMAASLAVMATGLAGILIFMVAPWGSSEQVSTVLPVPGASPVEGSRSQSEHSRQEVVPRFDAMRGANASNRIAENAAPQPKLEKEKLVLKSTAPPAPVSAAPAAKPEAYGPPSMSHPQNEQAQMPQAGQQTQSAQVVPAEEATDELKADHTMRVVIVTDDIDATRGRVENYLRAGGWSYSNQPTVPTKLADTTLSASARAATHPSTQNAGRGTPSGDVGRDSSASIADPDRQAEQDRARTITPPALILPAPSIILVRAAPEEAGAVAVTLSGLGRAQPTSRPNEMAAQLAERNARRAAMSGGGVPKDALQEPPLVNLLVEIRHPEPAADATTQPAAESTEKAGPPAASPAPAATPATPPTQPATPSRPPGLR